MSQLFPVIIMLFAGAAVALQPSINARLAQKAGFLESACISFAVGTAVLLIALIITGKGSIKGLSETAWWEWTGGLLGAFFVSVTIVVIPRIGTAAAMASTICAQLITGIILDHFGLFGYGGAHIDMKRTMGAVLLITGAWLIIRR